MSSNYGGYMGKFLDIDLTGGVVGEYEVSDALRELYLGSKGLATRILYDTLPKGTDPLSPDNVLIANTGPLVGSGAPCTSRFNVTTKSPLTGGALSCNCGGNFGMSLKRAGYDGIIVRGKAAKPTWIHVEEGSVELRDATDLWGFDTEETQEKLPKGTGKMVIGPAGENGVLYACIISQERAPGRALLRDDAGVEDAVLAGGPDNPLGGEFGELLLGLLRVEPPEVRGVAKLDGAFLDVYPGRFRGLAAHDDAVVTGALQRHAAVPAAVAGEGAARERRLGGHVEPARARGSGAHQRSGIGDEDVVRAQRVRALRKSIVQDAGGEPFAAEVQLAERVRYLVLADYASREVDVQEFTHVPAIVTAHSTAPRG